MLDCFHSVLSIPSDRDSSVRLLHLSFRDFLLDPEKQGEWFWVDEKKTHGTIVTRCLELMRSGRLGTNICNLEPDGKLRNEIDPKILRDHLPPDDQTGLPRYPLPTAHLGRLAVDQSCRGQGLGELLLELLHSRRCSSSSCLDHWPHCNMFSGNENGIFTATWCTMIEGLWLCIDATEEETKYEDTSPSS